jgi:anti-sigma factor RsiW
MTPSRVDETHLLEVLEGTASVETREAVWARLKTDPEFARLHEFWSNNWEEVKAAGEKEAALSDRMVEDCLAALQREWKKEPCSLPVRGTGRGPASTARQPFFPRLSLLWWAGLAPVGLTALLAVSLYWEAPKASPPAELSAESGMVEVTGLPESSPRSLSAIIEEAPAGSVVVVDTHSANSAMRISKPLTLVASGSKVRLGGEPGVVSN